MKRADCPTSIDEARVLAHLPFFRPRDALLVTLGFETALRISELLQLRVADVWKDAAPLRVLKLGRDRLKGGRGAHPWRVSARQIPINDRARAALIGALGAAPSVDPNAYLFPGRASSEHMSRQHAARIIRGVFIGAGLDPNFTWSGHSLRRRMAQRVYDLTHDINATRSALGHRWVTTTQAYLDPDSQTAREAIIRIGALPGAGDGDGTWARFSSDAGGPQSATLAS